MIVDPKYELTLRELLELLFLKWKTILLVPVVMATLVFAGTFAIKPRWEGGVVFTVGQTGPEAAIESPALTIARVTTPSFKDSVPNGQEAKFTAFANKDSNNIITLIIQSPNKESIKDVAQKAFEKLRQIHENISIVSVDHMKKDIAAHGVELNRLEQEIKGYSKGIKSSTSEVVLKDLLVQRNKIVEEKKALSGRLTPTYYFPTKMIGEPYVLESSIYPKRKLATVMVAVLTFLGALLYVVIGHLVARK